LGAAIAGEGGVVVSMDYISVTLGAGGERDGDGVVDIGENDNVMVNDKDVAEKEL